MTHLLQLWLRCAALLLVVPFIVVLVPVFAVLDSVREGDSPQWRCRHYYKAAWQRIVGED